MDQRKKDIKLLVLTAVIITAISLTAAAALAFDAGVGSEYVIHDGGRIVYGPGDGGYSNSKKTDLDDGLGERYSYCIQPDKDTPVVSRIRITREIGKDEGKGEWGALRRMVYFSPSYPGYEENKNGIIGSLYTGKFAEDWGAAHLAMAYIFQGRPSDMDTYMSTKASDLGDVWIRAKKLGDEMMKEDASWEGCVPENFRIFISGTEGYQSMAVGSLEVPGTVVIRKMSSDETITKGNSSYSLKGARYTLYNEKTAEVKELILDENGESGVVSLSPGRYTVTETEAPEGYAKDTVKYRITIISGEDQLLETKDMPITAMPEIILKKKPEGFDRDHGEGDGTLKRAVYCFEYYGKDPDSVNKPMRTWYFETDEKGEIRGKDPAFADGFRSDELYLNSNGEVVFPIGRYAVKEIKPSDGYLKDETSLVMEISEDGTDSVYTEAVSPAVSLEKVIRGGVRIAKQDAQNGEGYPQGDGTLGGAEISVINRSKCEVAFDGKIFAPGEIITTISTGEDGIWEMQGDALPFGTYSLKETKAPEGYLINRDWEKTFCIRKNGEVIDLSGDCVRDIVIRSGLMAVKLDGELMRSEVLGGSSFEGVIFTIRNRSENPVLVRSSFDDSSFTVDWNDSEEVQEFLKKGKIKKVSPGEDIGEICIRWNEEKKAYTAETLNNDLPYGTYGIRETETSESYQRSDKAEHILELKRDGELVSYDNSMTDILSFKNFVYRSDIRGTKIKDSTSERLSFVPFSITSLTNGETHVVVTDRNGYFFSGDRRTEDELNEKESQDTERKLNPFDDLLGRKNIRNSEMEAREKDIRMGVWFGTGENGSISMPSKKTGALPYDTYRIEEMRCEGNEGCALQKFIFTVDERSLSGTVDLATITDDEEKVVNRDKHKDEAPGKSEEKKAPKTGDTRSPLLWGITLAAAAASLICIKSRTKKTRL